MTHFKTSPADLAAQLAAHNARVAANEERRWANGQEDDSFVSQKCESLTRSELERSLELAEGGWKLGFVGLCHLDGSPVKGRWVASKFRRGAQNFMVTSGRGPVVFLSGDDLYMSRAGKLAATEKLLGLGFRWETRRLWTDCGYVYPEGSRGFAGLYSGTLCVWPVDADGNKVCTNALVYPAEEFFCDGASSLARGLLWSDEFYTREGEEMLAALNTPKPRGRKAA